MTNEEIGTRFTVVMILALATILSALGGTWITFLCWTIGFALVSVFRYYWDKR